MRKITTALVLACVMALATATGAMAQTSQTGLVNINIEDNVVQVPIAVAANICDVTVAVLATQLGDGPTTCDTIATSTAIAMITPAEHGGPTRQDGLVNVNLSNNTVQIPIAVAANVCDVDVLVLATAILLDDATECTARAGAAGIA
jgi:hypothetical protein